MAIVFSGVRLLVTALTEADPIDLSEVLQNGLNVVATTVLYYGEGDGTWPAGSPGFLFWLTIEYPNGFGELIVSDQDWRVNLCRAWPPGQFRRHFWRAFQEHFDARLYPYGWDILGSNEFGLADRHDLDRIAQ